MKKLIMLFIAFAGCYAANAQGYLGFGGGVDKSNVMVVNLHGGAWIHRFSVEAEMKAPPIDTRKQEPAVFSLKTGYKIALGGDWSLVPQFEYGYLYRTADVTKEDQPYKNGWKAGAGARLLWGHLFAQAEYIGQAYVCIGITSLLKK